MTTEIEIGERIRYWLGRHHMSQRELARRLSVDSKTVNDWVHGERTPRLSNLERLAGVFGLSVSAFTAPLPTLAVQE